MLYEFGGSARFAVFGTVEVPNGTTPQDFMETKEGREAVKDAFAEWWENTGIKFRDADVYAESATPADDENHDDEEWPEVVLL